jgi:hypothetical protein
MTEQTKGALFPWLRTMISVGSILVGCASVIWTQAQNNQSATDHFNELKAKVERIEGSVNTVKDSQVNQIISNGKTDDKLNSLADSVAAINRHLEADDARMNQMEGSLKILDTNQQLLNQQLQYIGTSHIVPSIKK